MRCVEWRPSRGQEADVGGGEEGAEVVAGYVVAGVTHPWPPTRRGGPHHRIRLPARRKGRRRSSSAQKIKGRQAGGGGPPLQARQEERLGARGAVPEEAIDHRSASRCGPRRPPECTATPVGSGQMELRTRMMWTAMETIAITLAQSITALAVMGRAMAGGCRLGIPGE